MKASREQLEQELMAVKNNEGMLMAILNDQIAGKKPDAVEKTKTIDGERYEFRLHRTEGALAGILLVIFHCKGQRPHFEAHAFDDFKFGPTDFNSPLSVEISSAYSRIRVKRYALLHMKDIG